jgi:hypothetical protein
MTVSLLLGLSTPNSVKFFATLELLEQARDRTWPAKITNAVSQHWQRKNAEKKICPSQNLVPMEVFQS